LSRQEAAGNYRTEIIIIGKPSPEIVCLFLVVWWSRKSAKGHGLGMEEEN
jgi:hypothetical protein